MGDNEEAPEVKMIVVLVLSVTRPVPWFTAEGGVKQKPFTCRLTWAVLLIMTNKFLLVYM